MLISNLFLFADLYIPKRNTERLHICCVQFSKNLRGQPFPKPLFTKRLRLLRTACGDARMTKDEDSQTHEEHMSDFEKLFNDVDKLTVALAEASEVVNPDHHSVDTLLGRKKFMKLIDVLVPAMELMKEALGDEEGHLHRSGKFDAGFRDILTDAKKMMGKLSGLFSLTNTNEDWDEANQRITEAMGEESELATVLEKNPLIVARNQHWEYENGTEFTQPDTFFLMNALLLDLGLSVCGAASVLTRHISEVNSLEEAKEMFPVSNFRAETVGGLGHEVIQYADSLAEFDYSMSDVDAERLSDLLQTVSGQLLSFAGTLQKLPIGEGPYKSVLSEVGSHVVTNENNPRQTYRNLGMWPLEETDEWRDLAIADISNWLGMDRHSQNIPMAESHQIVYRDFLDYVQSLGYAHQKVTTYAGNERRQPMLSTFTWKGEKRKYRANAHIYFYNPSCPVAGREMRLVIESHSSNFGEYINCFVGLNLMPGEEGLDEEQAQFSKRKNAEDFLDNLVERFEAHQHEFGLLKNAKFSAAFEELKLKGRTFDDIILTDTKRHLLEDNIFTILEHSDRLIERGVETNRGIMLAGPPGVGKSMTIDAIVDRGSCTVLFATFAMLQGAMERIFQVARKYAPTILILEDIDALGITGQRSKFSTGAGLSTLLNCMDGINSNNGVITVATSNHPENMDWALVARPGRFDVRIDYPYPDQDLLHGILELKLGRFACEDGLDLTSLVKKMPHGFTGSHMQDIVNQANYISLGHTDGEASTVKITQEALKRSFERTLYNFNKFLSERPGLVFAQEERKKDDYFG